MKILVACDSFKGSLSSREIIGILKDTAEAMTYETEVTGVEIADGGEGTIAAVLATGNYKAVSVRCMNPLFEPISAAYAVSENAAIIEMAAASGLTLIPYKDGNALYTTTYGTGELIADAVQRGIKHIYISIGGSATNDGGIGALTALGFAFLDVNGEKLKPIGENLCKIARVDRSEVMNLDGVKFTVMADVENPLIGENGATHVYGKQKGAVGEIADKLESGMKHYADITEKTTGIRLHDRKSAGAAGGLGGGLIAYMGAEVKSGIESVLQLLRFDSLLKHADVVITGEGRIDSQSKNGKAVCGICKAAKKYAVPVYAVAGSSALSENEYAAMGINKVFTLLDQAASVEDSMKNAKVYMKTTAEKMLKYIQSDNM